MKKRFTKRPKDGRRRRTPKTTLVRQVQELYPAAGDDDSWAEALEEPPAASRPPRRAAPSGETGPAAADDDPAGDDPGATTVEGLVVSIGSGYCTIDHRGERLACTLPSRLARDQRARLAVGDRVRAAIHDDGSAWVRAVLPRHAALSRPDPHNPRRQRVIAANVDLVVHVASVVEPPLRPALIDRFLLAIEQSGAAPLICVNKVDLLPAARRRKSLAPLRPYREQAVPIVLCSAASGEGLAELSARLAGRLAVLVGHSGVGKSSLLNALHPATDAATGRLHARLGTGRHTTTAATLYHLPGGATVIDTPGIRELGLWQLDRDDLARAFPDVAEQAAGCRFNDCAHRREPDCAVRAAIADGRLPPARLAAYRRILASLDEADGR